ncbi:MAG: cell division protein FtsZ, partial [Candidatus Aenigmatarchaeota archaeon]
MAIKIDSKQSKTKKIDEELKQLLESKFNKIRIIGCGGAGNNTITRLMDAGIEGAETIIINTDAQDLLYSDAHTKILIGRNLTKGLGAGGDPQVGMEAARESRDDIRKAIEGSDMIFLTCGLGGGT